MKIRHPNYLVGFIIWAISIVGAIYIPRLGLFKKTCKSCAEYSKYVESLSENQKSKLVLFEAGVIDIGNKYYYVGDSSNDELDLYKNNMIRYQVLEPTVDESTRRLIIINSLMKTISIEERDLIFNRKAALIFRNNGIYLISEKSGSTANY